MLNLETLKKLQWTNASDMTKLGEDYIGYTCVAGVSKARLPDGSEEWINAAFVFKKDHSAFDLKSYVDKFENAILSLEDLLKEKNAVLI